MTQLKRPLTLSFQTRGLGRLAENDVVTALTQRVKSKDIKAVQVTESACRVTMANVSAKQRLISSTITLKNKELSLNDVDRSITHVTVKDAPYEMNDMVVSSALAAYGEVVQGSIRRGKVKDGEIETGTRYMSLYDAKDIVPSTVTVGDFDLRVFCDNNRTECKHCGLTSHPHYKCPVKPKNERACYRCFSTRHMVQDCTNDIVCRYCSQTGHSQSKCDEYKEFGEKKKYGEYYHDIREGREDNEASPNKPKTEVTKANETAPPKAAQPRTEEQSGGDSEMTNTSSQIQEEVDIDTLVLGDSNLKHVANSTNVFIQAESGATFLSTKSLMGAASKQTDTSGIKTVVLHLGTNDVTRHGGVDIMLNASRAITDVENKFPDANIAICSVPPRKGSERQQSNANDTTVAVNSYLHALCRRGGQMLFYIDTYALLSPKGSLANHLFSKTDPSGVHFSRQGKVEVISYISAALETREKQNKNSGKQKGKRMPSASPLGSAEHRSKKTLVENMDDESDSESDSDSVYSHDPTPSSSTAPPTTTPIEH